MVKTQVLRRRYNAQSVGVTHTATPALHAHYCIASVQDTKFHSIDDTPCQTTIDVLLPWHLVEIWLLLWEPEGIDTTVQMRVLVSIVSFAQTQMFWE